MTSVNVFGLLCRTASPLISDCRDRQNCTDNDPSSAQRLISHGPFNSFDRLTQHETYVEVSGRRRIPGAPQHASNLETSQVVAHCLDLLKRDRAHQVGHGRVVRPRMVAEIHQRVN